jgi:DNA polymerase (family 10)
VTRNAAFADALLELADYLEADDVDYKPQMYRTAAANVRDYPEALESLVAENRVTEIEGVGESIAAKATSFVEEGQIDALERERERLPVDMKALTAVEGLGPKRIQALYDALGITDLDELEAAASSGEIATVEGFGEKTEQNILDRIDFARQTRKRALLGDAKPLADAILDGLAGIPPVESCAVAGSLRRWKETIGDVDVLVGSQEAEAVIEAFTALDRTDRVVEAGTNKASIRADGMRVDLRVVVPDEYGAALQYFTGSREHNIKLRNEALERGYKINEYGVFDVSDVADPDAGQRVGTRVAGATEASVYEAIDLPFIEPELREDRGEIGAARSAALPDLVTHSDIRGDLHTHTEWSDGRHSIEEMAAAADAAGHDYLVISDHAEGPGIFGQTGLSDAELEEQVEAIHGVAESVPLRLLTGVEVNIDADGNLRDTDPRLLDQLDCVIASPHSALNSTDDATERLIQAVEHPGVNVLGHPSGRLLNQREGLEFDVSKVAAAAAESETALEVNANPSRLDLWGGAVRTALEEGATIAINTDAHSPAEFDHLLYGVHTARRGWAEPSDILNTAPIEELMAFLE